MLSDDTPHILVIDDDTRLRELLRKYLSDNGFWVTTAADAAEARRRMEGLYFDVLILDRMMPGEDGLSFARTLRPDSDIPILMLTAMGEVEARIDGLEAGVDDYLSKPFEPRELLLRIRTIRSERKRRKLDSFERIRLGCAEYDPEQGFLTVDGEPMRLTSAEAASFRVIRRAWFSLEPRRAYRRCAIDGGERAIDVQVTRLRRKIEPDPRVPQYLQTVRGRGYVLRPD